MEPRPTHWDREHYEYARDIITSNMLAYALVNKRAIQSDIRTLAQEMKLKCRVELQELERLYHGSTSGEPKAKAE